jgi:hypothetical protein
MQTTITWRKLEKRFREIPDRGGSIRADGTHIIGGEKAWSWFIKDCDAETRRLFQATAELAGEFLAPGSGDALTVWLDALRQNRVNFSLTSEGTEVAEDGTECRTIFGTILRLREASAAFCAQQEARSFQSAAIELSAAPVSPHPTPGPPSGEIGGDAKAVRSKQRRAFVEPLLDKKDWSTEEWAIESHVDFHTANDYLKGITKTTRTKRKNLADSLGVKVEELPK